MISQVYSPVALRPYQNECISAVLDFVQGGGKRALVALPTASGKTVIFAQLPNYCRKKMLVIAHREELLDQARDKLLFANPGLSVSIEQAERKVDMSADVIIASIQTLSVSRNRLAAFNPEDFSLIVVDEAHHCIATSYLDTLHHFGLAPDVSDLHNSDLERREVSYAVRQRFKDFRPTPDAPFLLGFTATPNRTDGRGLEWILDEIVYQRSIQEMMEEGWLCRIRGERIDTTSNITGVKLTRGDFAEKELSEKVNTPERNRLAVSSYADLAKGRKALVFCVDVAHTQDLCQAFINAGIRASYVIGSTPKEERSQIIHRYKYEDLDVLVNCMVFTEGFDAPETSCIVMARPTKSSLLYMQLLGRGTRPSPSKEDLLVIDLVDIAKAGVNTVNTLFGLPPKLGLKPGFDVLKAKRAMEEFQDMLPLEMLGDVTTLDQVRDIAESFDPLRASAPEEWLGATMLWVKTGFGYALALPNRTQLGVVVNLLGACELKLKEPAERTPWGGFTTRQSQLLARLPDPAAAIQAGEDWVRAHISAWTGTDGRNPMILLDRSAKWLREPASEKQLAFAQKLGLRIPPNATKGQMKQLIDSRMAQKRGR